MYDQEVIVGEALALVNVLRQAHGKDPLNEFPDAKPGDSGDCLFYRAFGDLGVTSVSGPHVSFASNRVATAAATLWGTNASGSTVETPRQFTQIVDLFDGHEMRHYDV